MNATVSAAPLFVLGLGPGDARLLAPEASVAIDAAKVVVGYSGYINLLPPERLAGKRVIATGMTGEMTRTAAAINAALGGEPTAIVCSGDPGVYALAGLALEMLESRGLSADSLPLTVVPGIPAVCAAAALLGAPLMHDFACVSLSDLLTPWAVIAKRLRCALEGDFVVAIYNPRSKRRTTQFEEAITMARACRSEQTPVGIVKNAYRPGQEVRITPLGELEPDAIDMFTIVIVGSTSSRIVPGQGGQSISYAAGARMLTPRGYMDKYGGGTF